MTNTELFGETITETTTKYETWEAEALRKKAEAADNHIKTLEEENKNLRENYKNTATLEDVLKKLDMVSQPPVSYQPAVVNPTMLEPKTQSEQLTKQDILNIYEQKQKELQAKANVDQIKKELLKAWGENFSSKLSERSKEIGVNQDFLANMAENYPEAFLKLILEPKTVTNPNSHISPSTVRSPTTPTLTGETRKEFRTAEKANPALLSDPVFQARKHAAAQRLGDAFFR